MYMHNPTCSWDIAKAPTWTLLNLWMIDEDMKPIWSDGGGYNGSHPFMPCKESLAWPELSEMVQ
jgi:hypothetical protein